MNAFIMMLPCYSELLFISTVMISQVHSYIYMWYCHNLIGALLYLAVRVVIV